MKLKNTDPLPSLYLGSYNNLLQTNTHILLLEEVTIKHLLNTWVVDEIFEFIPYLGKHAEISNV